SSKVEQHGTNNHHDGVSAGRLVLLVSPDEAFCRNAINAIEACVLDYMIAKNFDEAREIFQRNAPRLLAVLLDGNTSGKEAAAAFTGDLHRLGESVPILLPVSPESRGALASLENVEFLAPTLSAGELSAKLRRYQQHRRVGMDLRPHPNG
ncbi:MAG: hypothetical protein JJU11_16435, partial [Candidatus Sumerlaeia bacterium]|nr:hypothetical protein [Candidatus Sumerlaeia bacterium]